MAQAGLSAPTHFHVEARAKADDDLPGWTRPLVKLCGRVDLKQHLASLALLASGAGTKKKSKAVLATLSR